MTLLRIGMGYDVHALVSGRDLILGGVKIPFEKGLMGHSDADALIHAICDALLGAAGLGDIGIHFPDTDSTFKDIYSIKLLKETCRKVRQQGFSIVNLDTTIFAQAPKISPYRDQMKETLALAIEIDPLCINIKATTTESLGTIGRGEGIAAMCVVLLEMNKK